ncbi:MAG TPA: hypothetical protein EYG21_00015 [Nitrospinaceae bacterium]|jgi:hypothetical protein|nr:hypothetical protein [Nitrospinaceae bacterium]
MTTVRFALDARGKKVPIGSTVIYKEKLYKVNDIEYLSWNINQYLTLSELNNKNKTLEFISSHEVISYKGRRKTI